MPARHVVVDGSNIATEGSSLPSLKRLDEAVREFLVENPDDVVTVVVDATFGHRIPPEERPIYEEAEDDGDIVSPPAGAIGRGDAFLLRIADKIGAVVLSNDSFQEFHGEYEWLFDKDRLIGGKPVPGVGWIFTPRNPVRGPRSRESVKEAKRKKRTEQGGPLDESGLELAAERSRSRGGERKLQRAIAVAVEEAVEPEKVGRKRRRRRRGTEVPSEPLNEPFNFITFIATNQLGAEVEGTVEEFSSHGAFISVDGARCYVPLSGMGDEAPRSAREVLRKGEKRIFVVQAFDAVRRGIELALPGFARPAGIPTPETIDAEIHRVEVVPAPAAKKSTAVKKVAAKGVAPAKRVASRKAAAPAEQVAPAGPVPAKRAATVRGTAAAKKAVPTEKALPAKKAAPVKKASPVTKAAAAEEVAPARKRVPAKKAAASKQAVVAEKAAPVKRAAAKTGEPAKKVATGKQTAVAEQAAPVKRAGGDKRVPGKKAEAAKKVAPANEAAPAGRAAARKEATVVRKAPPVQVPAPVNVAASRPARMAKRAGAAKDVAVATMPAVPEKVAAGRARTAAKVPGPAQRSASSRARTSVQRSAAAKAPAVVERPPTSLDAVSREAAGLAEAAEVTKEAVRKRVSGPRSGGNPRAGEAVTKRTAKAVGAGTATVRKAAAPDEKFEPAPRAFSRGRPPRPGRDAGR
jgi:hypothetical protein